MGNKNEKNLDNSKENIYNFNVKRLKEKAGAFYTKFNWSYLKNPLNLFRLIIISFQVQVNPFTFLVNTLYDEYFQNITESQSRTLVKTLNDEFSNLYNSIESDLKKLIQKIIKQDDINNKTKSQFEKNKNIFLEDSEKSKEINILVIGKTGVGKSTLINTLLKLEEENMAYESKDKVGTLEFKKYSSEHWKNINLIDSRGFDFEKPIESYQKDILNYVKKSNEDIIKFIDIIYYCFKDNRFEEQEKELLVYLKEMYKEVKVPFIFVYTKDVINNNFEAMENYVKKELNDDNLIIVDILAKDIELKNGNIIKSFGIQELKSETENQIKTIKDTAFYKKFYSDCLNKLYNSEEIDDSYVLNNLIKKLILNNRKKYNFKTYKELDEYQDTKILKQIKKISDLFVSNFNKSIVKISNLVREYHAESEIRGKRKNKSDNDLNASEIEEKDKLIRECNINDLQQDIQKLIIGEYANCLNKFIKEMFEKNLKKTYDSYINSWCENIIKFNLHTK